MTEAARKPNFVRRAVRRVARSLNAEVRAGQESIAAAIQDLHLDLGRVHREMEETTARVRAIEIDAGRSAEIARHSFDREPENRRLLHELRQSEEYELAFTEADPLVSFLVPTYTSYESLRDVALPSILGQTYSNVEVIVVGDAAPPETEEAIAALGDDRVRYSNRTYRGPYPEDPEQRWRVAGGPPFNDAVSCASGDIGSPGAVTISRPFSVMVNSAVLPGVDSAPKRPIAPALARSAPRRCKAARVRWALPSSEDKMDLRPSA